MRAAFGAAVEAVVGRARREAPPGGTAMSAVLAGRSARATRSPTTSTRCSSVYLILIFVRILLSWIPRIPYNPVLSAVVGFIHDVTDPVPEPLPAHPAAGRRRRLRARPEPDHRDHRAAASRGRSSSGADQSRAERPLTGRAPAERRRRPRGARAWAGRWRARRRRGARPGDQAVVVAARAAGRRRWTSVFGFELSNVRNEGVAFGLLAGPATRLVLALTLGALEPAGRLLRLRHRERPGLWLAVGLRGRWRARQPGRPRADRRRRSTSSTRRCGPRSTSPTSRSSPGCDARCSCILAIPGSDEAPRVS